MYLVELGSAARFLGRVEVDKRCDAPLTSPEVNVREGLEPRLPRRVPFEHVELEDVRVKLEQRARKVGLCERFELGGEQSRRSVPVLPRITDNGGAAVPIVPKISGVRRVLPNTRAPTSEQKSSDPIGVSIKVVDHQGLGASSSVDPPRPGVVRVDSEHLRAPVWFCAGMQCLCAAGRSSRPLQLVDLGVQPCMLVYENGGHHGEGEGRLDRIFREART